MERRDFLSSAALAASTASAFAQAKPKRVGLIGCGWYGKADLIRLLQVAPATEVVSLCDVDKNMLAQTADRIAVRQASKKRPRTYADYREMLKERDLDIVLIGTPDHWHALTMMAAVEAGADVYCQKPISVDVAEGKAMLEAARKHNRVVQVGTQRRSTPHLAEARDIIQQGKLGKIAYVEICCYYHMRARTNPPDTAPPGNLDWEMWTGPAPMRPYNELAHPRRWRAFMEYGNGIVGDMCIHMLDMVRWMMDLGWPRRVSSAGGILVDKASKANISDTQTATFDFPEVKVVWTHRSWGHPPDPQYPWAAIVYGEKGTLKAGVMGYDYIPLDKKEKPIHKDVTYELEQYPEDKTEEALEKHVAPAIRYHMLDLLAAIEKRSKPVADIEQGFISTSSCIMANMAMKLGRTLEYDPATHTVRGDAEATQMLLRPYRAPWEHPGKA